MAIKKTVTFKSGRIIEVSQANANHLKTNILKGCNNMQIFSTKEDLDFMVNLSEVESIQ